MTTLSEDLLANPKNPRQISENRLSRLRQSMNELGDCSQITKNVHPDGGGFLVCGHQRAEILKQDPDAQVFITKHYKEPTRTGTVAEGYILSCGETYGYREVHWDKTKAKIAALVGNNHVGEYDEHLLVDLMHDLKLADVDLDSTLFLEEEWSCLLPDEIPEHFAEQESREDSAPVNSEKKVSATQPADAPEEVSFLTNPNQPQSTHVKQVQLFFDAQDHAKFIKLTDELQSIYGSDNLSDTVYQAIQRASVSAMFADKEEE